MMGSMVGWIVLVLRVNEDSNKNQTEWSPNMQLPPYPYIHAPPSLFGCEAGSLRLGPPGKWLKKMNKLYSIQIYYEIHESWAPTSSVHRLELPTYTWRVKNIQTWPTKGVSKGKGSISGLYIYIYMTNQVSFDQTTKTKTTCLIGANFLESLHEGDLAIHTHSNISQLTVGDLQIY